MCNDLLLCKIINACSRIRIGSRVLYCIISRTTVISEIIVPETEFIKYYRRYTTGSVHDTYSLQYKDRYSNTREVALKHGICEKQTSPWTDKVYEFTILWPLPSPITTILRGYVSVWFGSRGSLFPVQYSAQYKYFLFRLRRSVYRVRYRTIPSRVLCTPTKF